MKKIFVALLSLCFVFTVFGAGKGDAAHRQAALAFLVAKGTPDILARNCRLMLEKQVAMAPEYASHRAELEKFYFSTFGFEALKEDLIALYVREYSLDELRKLTEFFNSPLGKKSVVVEGKLLPEFSGLLERKAKSMVSAGQK